MEGAHSFLPFGTLFPPDVFRFGIRLNTCIPVFRCIPTVFQASISGLWRLDTSIYMYLSVFTWHPPDTSAIHTRYTHDTLPKTSLPIHTRYIWNTYVFHVSRPPSRRYVKFSNTLWNTYDTRILVPPAQIQGNGG